jgi:C_GCAxxG_C_C family probable redox protein
MDKAEEAVDSFKGTFNCAQSVFSSFAPELGLERKIALKVATPFGGGIARMGEVCGAVTGAMMGIGLNDGMSEEEDLEAKERTYGICQELASRFKARNGSIKCRDLIGYDLSNPEEHKKAEEDDVFNTKCTKFVRDAVEIVEELFRKEKASGSEP